MNIVERLADLLRERQWMLATAESCTGGMIAAACTDLSGSSEWFERGFVTYSNEAKIELLGISEEVAEILEQLSTGQMLKIASSNTLVCCFRFEDQMVWNLLTSHSKDRGVAGIHAAILNAGQLKQAA